MFHEKHYYHPSPTPFALQYGVISLQNSPLFRPQKHIIYKKEYRFCYITLNLYLCIKHLTRYEQRTLASLKQGAMS